MKKNHYELGVPVPNRTGIRRVLTMRGMFASVAVTSVILVAAAGPVSDIILTKQAADEITRQNKKYSNYGNYKKNNTGWYVPDQLSDISVEPTGDSGQTPDHSGWGDSPQDADSTSVIVPAETAPQAPQSVAAQDDDTSLGVDQLSNVNPTTSNWSTRISQNDVTSTSDAAQSQPSEPSAPTAPSTADNSGTSGLDTRIILDQPEPSPAVAVSSPVLPTNVTVTAPALPTILIPEMKASDLTDSTKKDIAMQLVSSAENSSLNWKKQYSYLEDIGDGRGYTGGIVGFCSGTHDMLELVQYYNKIKPNNVLTQFLPALDKVDGSDSHSGLGSAFESAWKTAAADTMFQKAQNDERDRVYFNPAVSQAKADGLQALGQFIYYDAMVMHGPGSDSESFGGIRKAALNKAKSPAQGGNETAYLNAFLDARVSAMKAEEAHEDTSRVDTAQRKFLQAGNLTLQTPLSWSVYDEPFKIN